MARNLVTRSFSEGGKPRCPTHVALAGFMTKEKECTETNHADPDPDVLAQCCRGDLVASS